MSQSINVSSFEIRSGLFVQHFDQRVFPLELGQNRRYKLFSLLEDGSHVLCTVEANDESPSYNNSTGILMANFVLSGLECGPKESVFSFADNGMIVNASGNVVFNYGEEGEYCSRFDLGFLTRIVIIG